jgi:hypothetical protein
MRRVRPYRGANPAPGKDVHRELDPTPGIREQPRPNSDKVVAAHHVHSDQPRTQPHPSGDPTPSRADIQMTTADHRGGATTTHVVRTAIQRSKARLKALAAALASINNELAVDGVIGRQRILDHAALAETTAAVSTVSAAAVTFSCVGIARIAARLARAASLPAVTAISPPQFRTERRNFRSPTAYRHSRSRTAASSCLVGMLSRGLAPKRHGHLLVPRAGRRRGFFFLANCGSGARMVLAPPLCQCCRISDHLSMTR